MFLTLLIATILSLDADFVQTKTANMLVEPQVSAGHMVYHAPDYIRWAYTSPQAMVWEVNGEQSNVNPQVQRLLRMIMSAIAGNNIDDTKLQRESKRMFLAVNIVMDETSGVAQQVELIEKNGDITIIEFSNVVAN